MPSSTPESYTPVPEATGQRAGALAPLSHPTFRAIWIANLASNIGSMVQSVGAAWLMTGLTREHQLIALVQASNTLPILLLGVVAGAIADNYDRRLVMIAAQIMMLIASAALAALAWFGGVTPYMLLALTLAVGLGTALNGPAWQASVRLQVPHRQLPQAISLNSIAFNLARTIGPALGGILVAAANPAIAFLLNTLSYTGMIVVLLRWHPPASERTRQSMVSSIMTGLRFCAGSGPIRRVLTRGTALGAAAIANQALMPGIARDLLHSSSLGYGLMLGAFGVGSIVAALFVGEWRRRHGAEWTITLATAFLFAGQIVLSEARSLPLAMLGLFISGGGWVAALTSLNVAMQLRSPEAILGRCMAIYQAVVFGAMALGAWFWGAMADRLGLVGALRVAALWLLLSMALRFIVPMPRREEGRVDPAGAAVLDRSEIADARR